MADDDAEARAIDERLARAAAVWPDLAIDRARFATELARRLDAPLTPALLDAIRADEVYLAIACADGVPAAVEHVERECVREADIAATRLRATPEQAADLLGQLRGLLFGSEPGRTPALATFSGRGDLRGYLKVVATRQLIRAINRGRREVPLDLDADAGVMFDRLGITTDAELDIMRRRYGADVTAALHAALAGIDDRGRALLRYYLIDGWNIERIGDVYGVHRATIARWLVAAREGIGDRVRAELAARLEMPIDEVSSIVRLVQSRVEVSFARLLGDAPTA